MLLKTIGFNGSHRLKWSKNSNGLRWHNLRFPRCSSNRFRSSSDSTYNPPFTTRSMRSERVQNDLGATAGLRYRNGRPRTSVTERVSGGGEPHPERSDQGSAAAFSSLLDISARTGNPCSARIRSCTTFRWFPAQSSLLVSRKSSCYA